MDEPEPTDDDPAGPVPATASGRTRAEPTREVSESDFRGLPETDFLEASLIVIAHPAQRFLGRRFLLGPGEVLTIGRDPSCSVAFAEVDSLSRRHAELRHHGDRISLADLGSTNGTWLRERRLDGPTELTSGDRFQAGAVHFKFLHEADPEQGYYEAIYELAVRDGLTGLFNRRKFQEEGEREFARALRHGRPLALLMFDIDRFKDVNDRYGHLRGDAVLQRISSLVTGELRRDEVLARIGGEEFAVVCPETGLEGGAVLAERLRGVLAAFVHPDGGEGFHVTCSFGVAAYLPRMASLQELLAAADQALYASKEAGRDRVTCAQA